MTLETAAPSHGWEMPKKFDPDDVLSRPLMANLATVTADGAPRNAPMWFIWEDAAIWLLGSTGASAVKHLERDPRCAVEIVDNEAGILLHLGLRGVATIEAMAPNRFKRLLHKYLGPEATWNRWFIDNVADIGHPDGRLIRLAPESTFTTMCRSSKPAQNWRGRQSRKHRVIGWHNRVALVSGKASW
ncbi:MULTISPECIES: pyridoxamine 5'-phosphate oxidase family protein [unclassified Mesorhizobium]|uniref:pyridoxamine 5'-phosphate oxidase family protein n=1 Tax=unclassified Mesorhizobium TaxID=325217 RepID=UPI0003CE9B62|nr:MULTISPECIES: pyridoxamine 5'-phosphate oxidase family protein [unclassified Mesorhizobium]ESW69120.1 pyridoxamine 5-phosphate oxidase [Mesorhizobium sp. LSJC277A00]ESX58173.1 pyridoxamine 5-phosphate oxidase [Mesorhizobium sp. LSHC422A00]